MNIISLIPAQAGVSRSCFDFAQHEYILGQEILQNLILSEVEGRGVAQDLNREGGA